VQLLYLLSVFLFSLTASSSSFADVFPTDNPALIDQERGALVSASVTASSNFASVSDLTSDQSKNFDSSRSQSVAIVQARALAGMDIRGFRIAAISRQDWFGATTGDTIYAYQKSQTSGNLPAGSILALQYELTGFAADGIQLGHARTWNLPEWHIRAGASATWLQARVFKRQVAAGSASPLVGGGINVSGVTTNNCTCIDPKAQGFIPAFQGKSPAGEGYTLDLGIDLEHRNGARFAWTITDAASAISWRSVPSISLSGSSTFNGQFPGGRQWLTDFEQALPVQNVWAVSIPMSQAQLRASLTQLNGHNFPMLGAEMPAGNEWTWGVAYDLFFRAVQLNAGNSKLRLKLRSDTWQADSAKQFGFGVELRQAF